MMRRARKDQQTYAAGEKGRNRVRVFRDPKTGIFQLEYRRNGRREARSLKHRDLEKAKAQADKLAANFPTSDPEPQDAPEPKPLTLAALFDMYLEEVTPKNSERHRKYDHAAAEMFKDYFGAGRVAATLSRRDFDRFSRERSSGAVGPGEKPWKPVKARTVQKDLSYLSSVLNWATTAGDGEGGVLLDRNPMKGYGLPREKNPRRVVLTEDEYQALLGISKAFDWRFHVALVLAHETGHRIGAIRKLTWADVDLDRETLRWRAENEKTGYEHETPMSAEARTALEFARRTHPGLGEAPVFPACREPGKPIGAWVVRDMWRKAERRAGLPREGGRGWHSLRRKFASDLMHRPLRVVCELGGWKDFETVLKCYQHADEGELREALASRRRVVGSAEQRE